MLDCGCLLSIMTNATKIIIDPMVGTIYLSESCFTFDPWELRLVQGGTPKVEFPQSATLPKNDSAVKFAKGPPNGISLDKLLKERFKNLRYWSSSIVLGIVLNR